ncbi:pentraxin-4-like [Branchiostoma floridae]|uniref:Pentraxin-4-like n=1 Tax=Branchiostoma floridae TaxID=7739 RepID=A0A9J7KXT9_BRAFL|nr:pentraxin-4-like [Branchiostoma floridae]
MSSEKLLNVSEVTGRARRDRPAARPVTVAVAAGAGVLVVAALVFLAHEVKYVRENASHLQDQLAKANDQILALKDRTLAMEIKQETAARDKEEVSSHKEEMTALKIHLSSLQNQLDSERAELQKEKVDGASLRERLAVLETKFQLGVENEQQPTYGTSHEETDPDVKPSEVGDDVKLGDHSAPLRRSKRAANTITTPYGSGPFRGPEGPAGRDGRDGRDGVAGPPGPPGPAGGCCGICERGNYETATYLQKTTFPAPQSVGNYAKLGTTWSQNLRSFTLCLQMRSDMSSNSAAGLVSYAVQQHHNEILILKNGAGGFLLFVQGNQAAVGVLPVWDGERHAVCATWRSTNGAWQVYIDGALQASGSGLSVGGAVRSGGTWILAQDQDRVGGGFQPDQAFIGELSQVNLWDRVLTPAEIGTDWSVFCGHHGNVIDWATTNINVFGLATMYQYRCS